MNKNFQSFLFYSVALSVILLGIHFILDQSGFQDYHFPFAPYMIAFYFVLYTSLHFFLVKLNTLKPSTYVNTYMGFTGLKLVVLLIFAAVFMAFNKEQGSVFTVVYSICYLLYTVTEIIWVYRLMKQDKPNS